jgi:hypothetical protein
MKTDVREYLDVGEMKGRVLRHEGLHKFCASIIAGVIKRRRFGKVGM